MDLNNTFGALLIGIVISAVLYGVTCTQTFYYFQNYPSDHFIVKVAVAVLLVLESLHSAFSIHAIYYYTILNFAHPTALAEATWSASMTVGISSGIMLVAHLFYARRVYYVSRKNVILVAVIALLAIVHTGTNLAVTVKSFRLKLFSAFVQMHDLMNSSLSLAIATDIIIAVSLTYYLNSSRSGVKSTDTMINKLMVYTINNGIVTSLFDILVVIFITTGPHNLLFLSVYQIVGNLYTNSMLATLNSRQSLTGNNHEVAESQSVNLFKIPGSGSRGTAVNSSISTSESDGIKKTIHVQTLV